MLSQVFYYPQGGGWSLSLLSTPTLDRVTLPHGQGDPNPVQGNLDRPLPFLLPDRVTISLVTPTRTGWPYHLDRVTLPLLSSLDRVTLLLTLRQGDITTSPPSSQSDLTPSTPAMSSQAWQGRGGRCRYWLVMLVAVCLVIYFQITRLESAKMLTKAVLVYVCFGHMRAALYCQGNEHNSQLMGLVTFLQVFILKMTIDYLEIVIILNF